MPPLPGIVLLLMLLQAASASAATFTCAKPSTCQTAIGYVVPDATTYEQLISHFSHTTSLHDLFAANQLPPDTAIKQAIPARTALSIPFSCRCTGDGVGRSDLYTKLDDGLVEIVTADNIHDLMYAVGARQKPWIPLPCSCDKVDGSDVMHFAYIVRSGDNTLKIAVRHGVPESTLLKINNITNHSGLHQGQILDIPLQGILRGKLSSMGKWSRAHYISGYRKRARLLVGLPKFTPSSAEGAGKAATKTEEGEGAATKTEEGGDKPFPVGIVYGVVGFLVGVLVLCLLSWLFMTCFYWRSALKSLSGTNGIMQFDYNDLVVATHRFSKDSLLGKGMYGAVYKANYKGHEVAVKKMNATEGKTADIHCELQTISKTEHKNLVRLKGWCGRIRFIDGKSSRKKEINVELFLVFELIPNGSLKDHLYDREQVLPWDKWYKIVKGIGSALRYLHHECKPRIFHRDIKPDNILLDHDFNAKLADFGLALITEKNRATVVTTAKGHTGYMDPKYIKNGDIQYSNKSDVYSFGIVLLEIACTGKTREEVWEMRGGGAQQVQVDDVADDRLNVFDHTEMELVVVLGLKCSHPEETRRPSMEDAMKILEDGQDWPVATQGEVGYGASCSVNGEDEEPMMPHGARSSC